jgi:thioester reductase-like protein
MAKQAPTAASTVLLTGSTGFLGSHVLRDLLLLKAQCDVAVVVRARHGMSARHRVRALVHDLSEEWGEQEVDSAPSGGEALTQAEAVSVERKVDSLMERVLVIEGSLEDESLWKRTDLMELAPQLRAIIHCAANVSFDAPLADALRHNTGAWPYVSGVDLLTASSAPWLLVLVAHGFEGDGVDAQRRTR